MLDQGSVRTKVSKIFTCNCWLRNRFAIGLLPDLRPEQISNHWASRVRTIDQGSRPFGPSVRTLDRVIWPKSPRFVRIVGRVYPILSGVLPHVCLDQREQFQDPITERGTEPILLHSKASNDWRTTPRW